jgi:hydroxyacylglutathione hydrolase
VARIEPIGPEQLAERLEGDQPPLVLDVRRPTEFEAGHVPGSLHIPFGDLPDRLDEVPRDRPIATICKAGARSGLAASVLQREGFEPVVHVARGGVARWRDEGRPVEIADVPA